MVLQTKIFDQEAVSSIQSMFTKLNREDKRQGLERLIRCYYRRLNLYTNIIQGPLSLENEFAMTCTISQYQNCSDKYYDESCLLWLNKLYLIDKIKDV